MGIVLAVLALFVFLGGTGRIAKITELIVQRYLVDFQMAERIKLASTTEEEIE